MQSPRLLATLILVGLSLTRSALSHELLFDQLRLSVTDQGVIHGQLLVDPELSGFPGARTPEAVIDLCDDEIQLEADRVRLRTAWSVRELYARGGATSADLLTLRAALPPGAQSLSVTLGTRLKALIVTVDRGGAPRSVLVDAGSRSPPYPLAATGSAWTEGGPELFEPAAPSPASFRRDPDARQGKGVEPWPEHGRIFARFLREGVSHVVPLGLDHVAFVFALVLGVGARWRRLVWLLSGFTLAHTCTLGLGARGLLPANTALVEILIALSITWVSLENWFGHELRGWRSASVVAFGLLHGMGFAGALSSLGARGDFFLTALLGFNVGVELGQLLVVLLSAALILALRRTAALPGFTRGASLLLAGAGLVWTVERSLLWLS